MEVRVRADSGPQIGRIVVQQEWEGKPAEARAALEQAASMYPRDMKTKFLMTFGGFLTFDLPQRLKEVGNVSAASPEAMKSIIAEARKTVGSLLTDDLVSKLRAHTRYVTIGIDSGVKLYSTEKDVSVGEVRIKEPHVELVAVVDLETGKQYWTGKSYPTMGQQDGLIRVNDLTTHFFKSAFGTVEVLGCHDLNLFNNRSMALARGWRREMQVAFRKLAGEEKPVYVLHHAHMTDTHRIWYNAWRNMQRMLPSIKGYASGIGYYRREGERVPLDKVLDNTKIGPVVDFIVAPRGTKGLLRGQAG